MGIIQWYQQGGSDSYPILGFPFKKVTSRPGGFKKMYLLRSSTDTLSAQYKTQSAQYVFLN